MQPELVKLLKQDRQSLAASSGLKSAFYILVAAGLLWAFIKDKEKEFIALYGRKNNNTGILANMTEGGDGTLGAVYTEERRKKQ